MYIYILYADNEKRLQPRPHCFGLKSSDKINMLSLCDDVAAG